MRKKRFLAVVLTASMVLGNSVMAMASASANIVNTDPAVGNAEGSGSVEGIVNKNVFSVELPTQAEKASVFDFIMDPQELVSATDAARYTSANSVVSGSMYFKNVSANGTYDLGPTSKALTVKNRSTMDVDVTLSANITGLTGVELISTNASDVPAFGNGKPSVYMALSGNEISGNGAPTISPITAASSKITTTISGADGQYEVSYNNGYSYALSSNSANFAGYSFALTGASGGGDYDSWTEVAGLTTAPKVTVTWTLTEHVDPVQPSLTFVTPEATGNSVAKPATGPVRLKIDWGKGADEASTVSSVKAGNTTLTSDQWNVKMNDTTFNGDLLQLTGPYLSTVATTTIYTVEFNTGTTVTFTLTA